MRLFFATPQLVHPCSSVAISSSETPPPPPPARSAGGPYRHIADSQWARLRCALKPEDRFGTGRVIRKHSQPSNVADVVHCLNIWLGQENDHIQELETAKPHGVFTLATHHIRQAEAIKAGIKRLIAARDDALGRPAPAAIPRQMD